MAVFDFMVSGQIEVDVSALTGNAELLIPLHPGQADMDLALSGPLSGNPSDALEVLLHDVVSQAVRERLATARLARLESLAAQVKPWGQ